MRFGGVVALDEVSLSVPPDRPSGSWARTARARPRCSACSRDCCARAADGCSMNGDDITRRSPQPAHGADSPVRSSGWSCSPSSRCASTSSSRGASTKAASGSLGFFLDMIGLGERPGPGEDEAVEEILSLLGLEVGRRPAGGLGAAGHRPPGRGGPGACVGTFGDAARRALLGSRRPRDRTARRGAAPGPPGARHRVRARRAQRRVRARALGPCHRARLRQAAHRGHPRRGPRQPRGAGRILRRTRRWVEATAHDHGHRTDHSEHTGTQSTVARCSASPISRSRTAKRVRCSACRFDVRAGSVTTVLGANGAGKSSLAPRSRASCRRARAASRSTVEDITGATAAPGLQARARVRARVRATSSRTCGPRQPVGAAPVHGSACAP